MKQLFLLFILVSAFSVSAFIEREKCKWTVAGEASLSETAVSDCRTEISSLSSDELSSLISWAIVSSDLEVVKAITSIDNAKSLKANEVAPVDFIFLTLDSVNNSVDLFKLFESSGFDTINARLGKRDIVYYTIESGNIELFEYLASSAKYSDLVNQDVNLLASVTSGDIQVFKKLIERGLDVNIIDELGCNVIDYANAHDKTDLKKYVSESFGVKKPRCKQN